MLQIATEVGRAYGVSLADMRSASQCRLISTARAVAMYICRQKNAASYSQIGRFFGGKHHTSVIYAVRRVARSVETDARLREFIGDIKPVQRTGHEYAKVRLPEDYGIEQATTKLFIPEVRV